MNQRSFTDPRNQEAMNAIGQVFTYYDLAGGVCLVSATEWGYGYAWETTWNACVDDPNLPIVDGWAPMGFRIRVREAELGPERTRELLTGTAFTLTSLKDFGTQTRTWAEDLMKILRKYGMKIEYRPFDGRKLPHMQGLDMRR